MSTAKLITIVDDDESLRGSLDNLTRSAGFRVQEYSSAEAFLSSNRARATDCLILDVRLAPMSGLELQRQIVRAEWRIPIIFITAHRDDEARARAIEAGAVAFLYEALHAKELLGAIDVAVGRA